jgi:lipopolysaccharide/colanic/teichoic acid biosynthesis glycosyltransferase
MYRFFFKRFIDIFICIPTIIILLPLFIIIGILISFDGGPIFFSHVRIGLKGRRIKIFKFRSMVVNAEEKLSEIISSNEKLKQEWFSSYKLENDPRETSIGRFLRKSKIDELPQLLNIVIGQMSLVGPRPLTEKEFQLFFTNHEAELKYQSVHPGLTGAWQVLGSENYSERIQIEISYVENMNFKRDLEIILKTIKNILLVNKK